MLDIEKYILPEQEYWLEKISYEKMDSIVKQCEAICTDVLSANMLGEEGIRITIKRCLRFDPESLFELIVIFMCDVKLNQTTKDNIEWDKINIAEEIMESGGNLLSDVFLRMSLLISQITSCIGQTPIITPPTMMKEE